MNILKRLKVALGAMFQGRDVIGEEVRKQVAVQESRFITYSQNAKAPDIRLEPLVKSGWRRNELIYTCVSKKANTASQVSLMVVNRSGHELPNHPLRELLKRPNPSMPESRFWMSVIIMMDFAGNVFFEKVKSKAGRTVQLWPMRPDWVRVMEASGQVVGYSYQPPGLRQVLFRAEDVIPFNLYDPLNQYFGYPPVAVAARTGDLDNAATDYIRLIFEEGGVPPGILTTTQPINETIAARIRSMWMEQYGGYHNWKAPVVIGNDTRYQATGLGLQELGLDILDQRSEVRICAVLNVPAVLAGSRVGLERATLANVREYQKSWWDNDLIPLYKFYADILRIHLVPEFGSDIDIQWNYDDVPALQEDKNQKRDQALKAFRFSAITRNQFNEEWGYPSLGPKGDVYLVSNTMLELAAGQPMPELPDKSYKALKESEETGVSAERLAMEMKMGRAVKSYFRGLLKRIEEEMTESKALEEKKMDSLFWNREYEILFNILLPVVTDIVVDSAFSAYNSMGGFAEIGVAWEIIHSQAVQWATLHTADVVAQISKTSMDGFLKEFEPWMLSRKPLPELIKALEKYYGPVRAELIAVTETTRAFAQGNLELWRSTGMVKGWEWVTAMDSKVCEICSNEKIAGFHSMDALPPPAHPSCRCGMRPVMTTG